MKNCLSLNKVIFTLFLFFSIQAFSSAKNLKRQNDYSICTLNLDKDIGDCGDAYVACRNTALGTFVEETGFGSLGGFMKKGGAIAGALIITKAAFTFMGDMGNCLDDLRNCH